MAAAVLALATQPAAGRADCIDPLSYCYCSLAGDQDTATFVAEVTAREGETIDLQVEGDALLDPGGAVPADAQLGGLLCDVASTCSGREVGFQGVFLLDLSANQISIVKELVAGRVGCDFIDGFEGLDTDQLAGVLTAPDCSIATADLIEQLGYELPECKDVLTSCGCAGPAGTDPSGLGLLIGTGLILGAATRRRRRSPSAG